MKDLKLDEHTGLVLEGGGMRGVFTCGVLDYLMDHDIRFPYVIGVSAGGGDGCLFACPVSRMHPVSVVVPSSVILTCWRNTIISA